uniref:Uncharacterized protein n=1 Tax=Oryza meridionalis TaxID=40149 RepID=A0A0E0EIZ4_9ORYZ
MAATTTPRQILLFAPSDNNNNRWRRDALRRGPEEGRTEEEATTCRHWSARRYQVPEEDGVDIDEERLTLNYLAPNLILMDTRLDTEVSQLMPDGEGHGADIEGGEVRLEVGGDHLQEHALQQLHLGVDGEEEEVEVPEHIVAGVAAAEVPGPPASSASVVATEDPPALTGKEAARAPGKDGGTSGSQESGDGDLGEEREGGGERPRRQHRRGAPVNEVKCAHRGGAAAGGGRRQGGAARSPPMLP